MTRQAIRCRVRGRVQGVFFRDSTRRVAEALDLSGYAQNLPDGSVEVVACGPDSALKDLKRWLADGPEMARVDSLDCEKIEARDHAGFQIG